MEVLLLPFCYKSKREHGYTDKTLSDYISQMNKNYWVVRKPIKGDKHQWTFLLGSNTELFKDYKSIEFFRMDSDEAQNFFIKLDLSKKQQLDKIQTNFFDKFDD